MFIPLCVSLSACVSEFVSDSIIVYVYACDSGPVRFFQLLRLCCLFCCRFMIQFQFQCLMMRSFFVSLPCSCLCLFYSDSLSVSPSSSVSVRVYVIVFV